jgi:hypothetical protein
VMLGRSAMSVSSELAILSGLLVRVFHTLRITIHHRRTKARSLVGLRSPVNREAITFRSEPRLLTERLPVRFLFEEPLIRGEQSLPVSSRHSVEFRPLTEV